MPPASAATLAEGRRPAAAGSTPEIHRQYTGRGRLAHAPLTGTSVADGGGRPGRGSPPRAAQERRPKTSRYVTSEAGRRRGGPSGRAGFPIGTTATGVTVSGSSSSPA